MDTVKYGRDMGKYPSLSISPILVSHPFDGSQTEKVIIYIRGIETSSKNLKDIETKEYTFDLHNHKGEYPGTTIDLLYRVLSTNRIVSYNVLYIIQDL